MWTGAKTLPNKRMKLTKPALAPGAAFVPRQAKEDTSEAERPSRGNLAALRFGWNALAACSSRSSSRP